MEKGNKISQNDNEHEHSWEKTRPRWSKEREDQWEKKWQKDKQTTAFCMLCVRARVQDKKNIVSDFTISIRM